MSVLSKLLRLGEGKELKRFTHLASYIETLDQQMGKLTDAELAEKTVNFRKRIENGESLNDLITEAYAVAREAAWRVLHQKHFLVQIVGAVALHYGNVAEMKTGEGKTLTSILPAYLNALTGKGVHIVTVNDYLAKRDAEQMGRVHKFLGLEVGVILGEDAPEKRRTAYLADITYGTNNQFGFDYLRDNMAHELSELVQRGQNYAIIDEVDSILIDEARTPLIISGPAGSSSKWYVEFSRLANLMKRDEHYEVDIKKRTIGVHEAGVAFVEDQLGISNLYESVNSQLVSYLNNAIRAKELFERDKDYIVKDKEVVIVDEFTGRVLPGRRFNEGLHQALEAKEKVEVQEENQTFASITLQNYFRLYQKLSGMTGTASTEAAELKQIYGLGVTSIPTNKPMMREDKPDLIYVSEEAKYQAVVDDIAERHAKQQPVLVGTTSVERSEYLSKQLKKIGIKHNVLNAKQHEREGNIVAEAGLKGAVTIATNMAGRGTDIVLGGTPEILTDLKLKQEGLDPITTPSEYQERWDIVFAAVEAEQKIQATEIADLGGLYVIGTERHESRRIDDQLRGRSGRQGNPGESRFYLSLQDELARKFIGTGFIERLLSANLPDDQPIENRMVSKQIKNAQTQIENLNFEIRKNVLKYDEVMNQQRVVVYDERNKILAGANLKNQVLGMIEDVVSAYVSGATAEGYLEDWDLEKLWAAFKLLYPISVSISDVVGEIDNPKLDSPKEIIAAIFADAKTAYENREQAVNEILQQEEGMRQVERNILLNVLDNKWRDHLYEMDALKEGVGLRAAAQRDPIVEYQREGYDMFMAMLDSLKEEAVGYLFNAEIQVYQPNPKLDEYDMNMTDEEINIAQAKSTIKGLLEGMSLAQAQDLTFSGPDQEGKAQSRHFRSSSSAKSNFNTNSRKRNNKTPRKSR